MPPTIGRIVHFVQKKPSYFSAADPGVVHLPAIVVAVWGESCVNLQVFTDGTNSDDQNMSPTKWITSVMFDGSDNPQPRSWHWPEIEAQASEPKALYRQTLPVAEDTTQAQAEQPSDEAGIKSVDLVQDQTQDKDHFVPGYEIAGEQKPQQS